MRVSQWLSGTMGPVKAGAIAAILIAVATLFIPNRYVSEARLLPVESKTGMGGSFGTLASAAAAFGVNVPGGEGSDANFVDIIGSRAVREQLLNKTFTFHVRKWLWSQEKASTISLEKYLDEANRDRAIKRMGEVLASSRDNKSKIITLRAETRSPELSQAVLMETLRLLEKFVQEKGRTRGGAKAIFAEARLADGRKELDSAESAFRSFLQSNRGYQSSPDPATRLQGSRLEAEYLLRRQLVAALSMSREQALMEEKNDIPIVNILDKPNLPIEKNSPARTKLVLFAGFLVFASVLVYNNRTWINSKLLKGL